MSDLLREERGKYRKSNYITEKRKLFETKLYNRNLTINARASPLVRISGPLLKWMRKELKEMKQRRQNIMTMHQALHSRYDVDTLCVEEDSPELKILSIRRQENYIKNAKEGGLQRQKNNTENTTININNQKTKMGRTTTVRKFQATNKQNLTREIVDMAEKGKPYERNCTSCDSSTK